MTSTATQDICSLLMPRSHPLTLIKKYGPCDARMGDYIMWFETLVSYIHTEVVYEWNRLNLDGPTDDWAGLLESLISSLQKS